MYLSINQSIIIINAIKKFIFKKLLIWLVCMVMTLQSNTSTKSYFTFLHQKPQQIQTPGNKPLNMYCFM